MSGPVSAVDAPPVADASHATAPCVEITPAHDAMVGRIRVRRALPRRGRRTVGAWCFADHMGPAPVTADSGVDIGPHPHIGLQTVTWLVAGEILHRDSLGSAQVIRPGELNLMTAGGGVAHSEEATGRYAGELHGIQLWVTQPESTRHGPAAFEHHAGLPTFTLDGTTVTVLVGELVGTASLARHDTPLVGAELASPGGETRLPLDVGFEHALVVLAGELTVDGRPLAPGQLGYLGQGRTELAVHASGPTRAMLLGGAPFEEPILMWWNYVARTREELTAAYDDWRRESERFGRVDSPLERIAAPAPYWPT